MSDEHLHEKWVPDVAKREGVDEPDQEWVPENAREPEVPDQEWLPEHAVVEGFDRQSNGQYACQWCAASIPGTQAAIDEHRATHS